MREGGREREWRLWCHYYMMAGKKGQRADKKMRSDQIVYNTLVVLRDAIHWKDKGLLPWTTTRLKWWFWPWLAWYTGQSERLQSPTTNIKVHRQNQCSKMDTCWKDDLKLNFTFKWWLKGEKLKKCCHNDFPNKDKSKWKEMNFVERM